MPTDCELLRRYTEQEDEAAFAEIVRRHLPLVYFSALRQSGGDAGLAEDVAQQVFAGLAHRAAALVNHTTLAGWLHTCTRYVTYKALREQRRRRAREQEAAAMHEQNSVPEPNLEPLYPILDEAIGQLPEMDRNVLLLRFFQGKSYREVADMLGLSENSANKRLERSLEKLRRNFLRRGVATTTALLTSALGAGAGSPLPSGLAVKVADASLAGSLPPGTGYLGWKIFFMGTKTKIITLAVLVAVIAAISLILQPWSTNPEGETTAQPVPAPRPPAIVQVGPQVAAPATPPAQPGMASVPPASEKLAAATWALNTHLTSDDWKDVGADTPENALMTIYWARKTGNEKREEQLRLKQPPVVTAASLQRRGVTMVPAEAATSLRDYGKLLGGEVVRVKRVSPAVVQMNVNEDWQGADDQIQEFFEFHLINGQWQYTQFYAMAE